MKTILIAIFIIWATISQAQDRLLVEITINGKRSILAFDTGSSGLMLFPKGAARLGLTFTNAPPDASANSDKALLAGKTEQCDLVLGDNSSRASIDVLEVPTYLDFGADGVIGWPNIRDNIFMIDAAGLKLKLLDKLPSNAVTWTKFPINTNSDQLCLDVPAQDGKQTGLVIVDTGRVNGIALAPKRWRDWKTGHPNQPLTLYAGYMPGAGLFVKEEALAREFSIGPLVVTDVPVTEANAVEVDAGLSGYIASIGLAAIKRFDFIVDGKHGTVYVRTKKTPPSVYQHNRLGAVFVPRDSGNDDLVAHVVDGSPADAAGIHNGDVLLKIGKLDVSKWRTDPEVLPLARFWQSKAGSKVSLTLQREDTIFNTTVVLREILSAKSKSR